VNILFICSRNKWRSLTAETIFKKSQKHIVKSAGTATGARIKVTENLIKWADLIFVMEYNHRDILRDKFDSIIDDKEIIVLGIPDEYNYMDPELIELLNISVLPYLDKK
jgi:predicted protein tyrosine phosphatase